MKKTFYQLHPLFLLLVGIMLGFTGICVSVIFAAFYYKIYWLLLVGIPASLFMGYWGIYSLGYHHIKIDAEGVFAPGDKQEKNAKIQYEVRVKFEDIEAVRIIRSIKNSKGKFIKSMASSPSSSSLIARNISSDSFIIILLLQENFTDIIPGNKEHQYNKKYKADCMNQPFMVLRNLFADNKLDKNKEYSSSVKCRKG